MIDATSSYIQTKLADAKPIIIGLGREGLSSYQFLRKYMPQLPLLLMDEKDLPELDSQWQEIADQDGQARFLQLTSQTNLASLGENKPSIIFKTPGLATEHQFVKEMVESGAELSSNTMLCFELINQLPAKPVTIGVTGTKGKSTTASLIDHILGSHQLPSSLAGNIGIPPLKVLAGLLEQLSQHNEELSKKIIVFELSSHQLREMTYSPHIAVIHNVTPEHLDYYADYESYRKAKGAITAYQSVEDVVIFNPELAGATEIATKSAGKQLTFAVNPIATDQLTAYTNQSTIFYHQEPVIDCQMLPLIGKHNLLNVLPAVIVARELGLSNQQIATAIQSFKPLAHRLEFVMDKNGVQYINDSQATTPEATQAALAAFPERNIHLIAGGSDKGADLQPLVDAVLANNVQTIILFPPTGEKIAELLSQSVQNKEANLPTIIHVSSMPEAVNAASQSAEGGDVVLLSPACASFGIFENYQDRGEQFKAAVQSHQPNISG